MKINIKINAECDISFGKLFDMYDCVCVMYKELNLSEECYFPKTNISKNLQYAYEKFAKRMKMKVVSD